jgi:peroxiredoxin
MVLKVGEVAPDFTMKDQEGKEFKLSEFRGKRVLLSFHPMAWTGVCAKQMQALEANYQAFKALNTVAVGISTDTVPSKKAWAESLGVKNTRLLSDFWPHGAVSQLYGTFFKDKGFSGRANILVDEKGKIAFVKTYDIPEPPGFEEIIKVIKAM